MAKKLKGLKFEEAVSQAESTGQDVDLYPTLDGRFLPAIKEPAVVESTQTARPQLTASEFRDAFARAQAENPQLQAEDFAIAVVDEGGYDIVEDAPVAEPPMTIGRRLQQMYGAANTAASYIPGMEKVGQLGASAIQAGDEAFRGMGFPGMPTGTMAVPGPGIIRGLVPQDALSAAATVLPAATMGVKAAGKAATQEIKGALQSPNRGKLAQMINPLPESNPIVGPAEQTYLERGMKLSEKIDPYGTNVSQPVAPDSPTMRGQRIREKLEPLSEKTRKEASAFYDERVKPAANDPMLRSSVPEEFGEAIRELDIRYSDLPENLKGTKLGKAVKQLNQYRPTQSMVADARGNMVLSKGAKAQMEKAQLSVADALDIRAELSELKRKGNPLYGTKGQKQKGFTTRQGGEAQKLEEALDAFISRSAKDTNLEEILSVARKHWKHYKDTYGSSLMKQAAKKDASQLTDLFSKSKESAEQLRNATGDLEPLKDAINEKLYDVIGKSKTPLKTLEKYTKDNADLFSVEGNYGALYSKAELDELMSFAGARENLLKTPKPVTQDLHPIKHVINDATDFMFPRAKAALRRARAGSRLVDRMSAE